jgi:hypothetical protein
VTPHGVQREAISVGIGPGRRARPAIAVPTRGVPTLVDAGGHDPFGQAPPAGSIPHATQCTNVRPGVSRSSTVRASSTVGAGSPDQRNGGGTSWSSQVNSIGIIAPGAKAGLVSRIRCWQASTGDALTSSVADVRPSVASTATTRRTARRLVRRCGGR